MNKYILYKPNSTMRLFVNTFYAISLKSHMVVGDMCGLDLHLLILIILNY